ncbi:MAG: PA2779 family protein [Magnetospirillum sp.]|nr:PA2779 family protein [Magnetospirillum sp.]
MRIRTCRPVVALATAVAMLISSTAVPARGALVSTETVLAEAAALPSDRERVRGFLAREDVRQALQGYGVSHDEAIHRVDALTDEEVHRLAAHIDDQPVGGDGLGVIIGAAVLVFVILLITDIAGLTKVFPWTRSIR